MTDKQTVEVRVVEVKEEDLTKEEWAAVKRGKKIPDLEERRVIIKDAHALGHLGTGSIFNKLWNDGWWWTDMRNDIQDEILQCIPCLRYDVKREGFHPARTITADNCWDHVEIDLILEVPLSENGYQNILTIIDVFTGYTVLPSQGQIYAGNCKSTLECDG
jgi:hypothetical protein